VCPTRANSFDRVATDPRMAFMRYMWRLTILDPRLSMHTEE